MNGVVVVSLRTGTLLFHKKYVDNFGLPNVVDEMNLGALLFAIQTYSRSVVDEDDDDDSSDAGSGATGLREYDMGENVLYFHQHPDSDIALQTVVFARKALGSYIGNMLVKGICACFAKKFADRLREPIPSGKFAFKKELCEYYKKVPPALTADIGNRLAEMPPWIMTVYSDCFLPRNVEEADGARARGESTTEAAVGEKAGAGATVGKRFPFNTEGGAQRWWWRRLHSKPHSKAQSISEHGMAAAVAAQQCHTFYLRDSQPGELELSAASAEALLELVVRMGDTIAMLGSVDSSSTGDGDGSSGGGSKHGDQMRCAEIVLQQKTLTARGLGAGKHKAKGTFGKVVEDADKPSLLLDYDDAAGGGLQPDRNHRLLVVTEEGFVAAFPLATRLLDGGVDSQVPGSSLLADGGAQHTNNRTSAAVLQPVQTSLRHLGTFLRFLSKEGLLIKQRPS